MSTSFMSTLWDLFVTGVSVLPWGFMCIMALFAFRRHPASKMLLLQAAGAAAQVVLQLGQWLIALLMYWMNLSFDIQRAEITIYRFLLFIALVTFALGYCLERFKRRSEPPGFPVQP